MDAKQLESELGRAEAIGQFVAEAEVTINQISPDLDYRRADLDGFVRAAWPYDGTPADAAAEFAEALSQQRAERDAELRSVGDDSVIFDAE